MSSVINPNAVLKALLVKLGDDGVNRLIDRLMSIPDCPVWIHEKQLDNIISIPQDANVFGKYHALSAIVMAIERGAVRFRDRSKFTVDSKYSGHKFDDSFGRVGRVIQYQMNGALEDFYSGGLNGMKKQKPRWFRFGSGICDVVTQRNLVAEAIGEYASLDDDVKARRGDNVRSFVMGREVMAGTQNGMCPV